MRFPALLAALVLTTLPDVAHAQCVTEELVASGSATADRLGYDVAISGDFAVLGAPQVLVSKAGPDGYVHVYRRSGGTWKLFQKLTFPNEYFGISVDTDGRRIVVGTSGLLSYEAIVYRFNGFRWEREQTITNLDGSFGYPVVIQGRWIAIGALSSGGKVHLYERTGGTWLPKQTIIGTTADAFGGSLALERGVLVVGARKADLGAGNVRVYRLQAGTWNLEQTLTPSDPDLCNFGSGVAISQGRIAVAAACEDSVVFYERIAGTWTEVDRVILPSTPSTSLTRVAVDLAGDHAIAGVPATSAGEPGHAYELQRSQGSWSVLRELCWSVPDTTTDFGYSVAIDSDSLVGSPGYQGKGAAFFYPPAAASTSPLGWLLEAWSAAGGRR